ncbi:hypothetical protein BC628DRAFT_1335196 [Trametes gibbosa]|nr:hypothetical protein BC628DRAFT_1335196 [Trametes gibbosa]
MLPDSGEPVLNVRKLAVLSFSLENNNTGWAAPLIHLFPNAEYLDLWTLYTREGESPTQNVDLRDSTSRLIVDSWRLKGKIWQAKHGTWSSGLRYLRVYSIVDLYCLGLSCGVSRLDMYGASPSLDITMAALSDCRPRCVWFPIASISDFDDEVTTLMTALARTRSVTHLMSDFAESVMTYSSPRDLLVRLGSLLRETAVSHIVIHIGEKEFPGRNNLFGQPPWHAAFILRSDEERPEALELLGYNNTKIHRVFVHHELSGVRAWEVRRLRTSSNMDWEELDSARVREIMIAEGLTRHDQ